MENKAIEILEMTQTFLAGNDYKVYTSVLDKPGFDGIVLSRMYQDDNIYISYDKFTSNGEVDVIIKFDGKYFSVGWYYKDSNWELYKNSDLTYIDEVYELLKKRL